MKTGKHSAKLLGSRKLKGLQSHGNSFVWKDAHVHSSLAADPSSNALVVGPSPKRYEQKCCGQDLDPEAVCAMERHLKNSSFQV